MDEDNWMAVLIGFFVFAVVITVVVFTATYTHESHLRDLRYTKDEMVTCLQTGHSTLDCRDLIFGRGG